MKGYTHGANPVAAAQYLLRKQMLSGVHPEYTRAWGQLKNWRRFRPRKQSAFPLEQCRAGRLKWLLFLGPGEAEEKARCGGEAPARPREERRLIDPLLPISAGCARVGGLGS